MHGLPSIIAVALNATATERYAASRLAKELSSLCSANNFSVMPSALRPQSPHFAVGAGAAAWSERGFFPLPVGEEDTLLFSGTDFQAITGSSAGGRGSLYAVYEYLERLGFRFFTPDMTRLPPGGCPSAFTRFNASFAPPVESRELSFRTVLDAPNVEWAAGALRLNTLFQSNATLGGTVRFAYPPGDCHTAYRLINSTAGRTAPQPWYTTHREWFWPRDDPTAYGQLCWSNASLVSFLAQRVRLYLRAQPGAQIISVSQNDNRLYCNDSTEAAVIEEEGSPMGPLLRAVNAIADAIADEFPRVKVSTLAYQYSRTPPRVTRPRSNVIVRLCSIECNFAQPMSHPSNAPFASDFTKWSQLTPNLYVWDYVTDFFDYMQPFPDVGHLAENVRWFVERHAIGLNEEGAHNSRGSDLAPLKTYVLSRAMWDPYGTNGSVLANEFGDTYYGVAWPPIREYATLFERSARAEGAYVSEHDDCRAPWLHAADVLHAARLFNNASAAAAAGGGSAAAALLERVETAKMSVWFLLITRWDEMRVAAAKGTIVWPAEAHKTEALQWFERAWNASGATAWDEKGLGLEYLRSCTRDGEKCYC
jgi:hypothetical protein